MGQLEYGHQGDIDSKSPGESRKVRFMRPAILLIALIFGTVFTAADDPAAAADLAYHRHTMSVAHKLPFPRGALAESVWASDVCWKGCGAHTAWDLSGCVTHDLQGHCLKHADAGDRACQRACRLYGGPYLPIE